MLIQFYSMEKNYKTKKEERKDYCGIQALMSTLKEEIVRYLFWERIMRIILQKNIIMQ